MACPGENTACPRTGYTLIELVLVMLLLCIVAGLAAPQMRNFARGRQAGDAAEQFVSVARWARTQAIARGEVYRINVDLPSKTYWLTVQREGAFVRPEEDFGQKFAFPDTVAVDCDFQQQPDGTYAEFEPTGRTDEGSLRLTSSTGDMVQVSCLSTTDQFQICPKDQQAPWGVHHTAKFIVGGQNP
jgi:prepilin-type N-terminal cleavage/methylation domain-containing protein